MFDPNDDLTWPAGVACTDPVTGAVWRLVEGYSAEPRASGRDRKLQTWCDDEGYACSYRRRGSTSGYNYDGCASLERAVAAGLGASDPVTRVVLMHLSRHEWVADQLVPGDWYCARCHRAVRCGRDDRPPPDAHCEGCKP